MNTIIPLSDEQRKQLLNVYRSGTDPRIARRAHVLLLLAEGWTWQQIRKALFCSNDLIDRTRRRFHHGGISAVLQRSDTLPAASTSPDWWQQVLKWVRETTPSDFGFFRSRWSCGLLAELLAWETGVRRSAETIRRGLHREGDVWRRPRPVVGPTDPVYSQKIREIRHLLDQLPPSEVAVFQDEVDVNLNPKLGPMWTLRGRQAAVATPGNNEKVYLAGSAVRQFATATSQRRLVPFASARTSATAAEVSRHSCALRQREVSQLPQSPAGA
ncbi:Transposase [Planctomycetales bacterium 10988]|nr:Transposase [Planctomycetales bacterium 10988]